MFTLRLCGEKCCDGLVMSALGPLVGMVAWVEMPCGRRGKECDSSLGGGGGGGDGEGMLKQRVTVGH